MAVSLTSHSSLRTEATSRSHWHIPSFPILIPTPPRKTQSFSHRRPCTNVPQRMDADWLARGLSSKDRPTGDKLCSSSKIQGTWEMASLQQKMHRASAQPATACGCHPRHSSFKLCFWSWQLKNNPKGTYSADMPPELSRRMKSVFAQAFSAYR